jgi:PAS domain S-box-containing protein
MNLFSSDAIDLQKACNTMFNATNEGLIITDPKGNIIMVNNSICEMFHYKHDELIGQKIEILIPEDVRKRHVKHRKGGNVQSRKAMRAFGSGQSFTGQKKNGEVFPVEISLSMFRTDGQDCVMALVADISTRVYNEQRLKTSEAFLKEAEKLANISHFEIDIDSGEMACSDQLYRLVDMDDARIDSHIKNAVQFIHPDDRRMVVETYFNCVRTDTPIDIRFRVLTEKGLTKFVHNTGLLNNKTKTGKNVTIFATLLDITEQVKIEQELRELNADLEERVAQRTQELERNQFLYKMIARNFPNGTISVFDKDLNYVFVEGKELYRRGITGDMLIGTSFLERVDPEVKEDIEEKLRSILAGEEFINFELKTREKIYMINAVGFDSENEENKHILMVSQNISALKQAEEDIQRSLEKEQHLNELKSRFVSMASHEFRTPLTAVLNSVSLLEKYVGMDGKEDKQQNHLKRIRSATKHLTTILTDFLSLDKLEQGKFELNPALLDIKDFSSEILQDFEGMLQSNQNVNYTHEGPTEVKLDKNMLTHVYNNLISNAIKYSPEGESVELKTIHDGKTLTIIVEDHGIGIPKDEQEQMFNRFFRANNATNIQGTGLGLNIVMNYIKMIEGDISFTSKENEGTTFTIILPLDKQD